MRRTRRPVIVLPLLAVVLSLAAGHASADSDSYNLEFAPAPARFTEYPTGAPQIPAEIANQRLDWKPCIESGLIAAANGNPESGVRAPLLDGLDCATVRTPLDWTQPDAGPVATFEISRLPARQPAGRPRQLLTSPGGPGAGSLINPAEWAATFPELRETYDLLGFDPRGTRLSSTDQVCDANVSGDPLLLGTGRNDRTDVLDFSTESVRLQLGQARDWVRSCVDRTPAGTAGTITYWQTVRDLDLVRELLGTPTWSYLGVSQGTLLGAELARTFPDRLDRVVLDSVVAPTVSSAAAYAERVLRQQNVIEQRFAPWLAARGTVFGDSTDAVLMALRKLRADLTAHPIPLPFDRTFSGNDLNTLFFGVDNSPYEALERKLLTLRTGVDNPTPAAQLNAAMAFRIPRLLEELAQDVLAAGSRVGWWTARNCNTGAWSHDLDHIVDTARQLAARAPLTYLGMNFTAACAFWPESHTGTSPLGYDKIGSAVLIANEKDPVTPISGARAVRALIPTARLITVVGTPGHLVLPQRPKGFPAAIPGTSSCARTIAVAYLVHGRIPESDTPCQPG
ncbi:alpha/beta fold hydrolase [Nocardia suismassiliense]|uniref:Alpha/beta fold hydrolase n=1 Tax=Nocardia suismassiliense TaxID=2077092 RepID=A0ABW6QY65_9NOCA